MALKYNERSLRQESVKEIFRLSLRENPIFACAAGTAVLAGGCTSMVNALILSLLAFVLFPLISTAVCMENERLSERVRSALFVMISAAAVFVLTVVLDSIFDGTAAALGIFAPLLAVDTLTLHRASPDAPFLTRREAVYEGLACSVCFGGIALPVAFIRELLGRGALFGVSLGFDGANALTMPFFGFILCGFIIAFIRNIVSKEQPTHKDDRRTARYYTDEEQYDRAAPQDSTDRFAGLFPNDRTSSDR